jgi:hypothetical protein
MEGSDPAGSACAVCDSPNVDPETRQELEATLAARSELGPAHDANLIDGFVERLDARLAERRPARPPKALDPTVSVGVRFALTVVSLIAGIPITAIALTQSGLAALVVAWAGIVLVNLVFSRSAR